MNEKILLGVSPVVEAEKIRGKLAEQGIVIALLYNQQTCTTGCSTTVELWAMSDDLPAIKEVLSAIQRRNLGELTFDAEQVNQVFDPDKPQAICPACGTNFSTTMSVCPDCGLNFD